MDYFQHSIFRFIYKQINIVILRIAFRIKGNANLLNLGFNKCAIIIPHPDDEILGLGGLILKILKSKGDIHFIYLTDGENSGIWPDKNEIRHARINLSEKACSALGVPASNVYRMHIPDGSIPQLGQERFENAVETVQRIIEEVKPDAVFTTHTDDYWPFDHVAAAHIAKEAVLRSNTRPELWYYWVWTWYNIRPWQLLSGKFTKLRKINIREHLKSKRQLSNIYLDKLTPDGKPWSGILPKPLLKAFEFPFEVVERIL